VDTDNQGDGVAEVKEAASEVTAEAETTGEATEPSADSVQLEKLAKEIADREKAAEDRTSKKWESHFQGVADKRISAAEKRARDAEQRMLENEATLEGLRETFLTGLEPEQRAEAERRVNAKVQARKAELAKPTPEQIAQFQQMQVMAEKAKRVLGQLEDEYDVEVDYLTGKCSDSRIDMSTPEAAYKSAKAVLKEFKNPKPKEPEKKAEPKKAPKVDEGAHSAKESDVEFLKRYGDPNADIEAADHKRYQQIQNKLNRGG